jgi:glycerate kinase
MKVLIATDKFKGSLTALQACEAIREGIVRKYPNAEIELLPLADGGEGMADLLTHYTGGQLVDLRVAGPQFEKVTACYGISGDGQTAFIESAKASGLQLLPLSKRNPMYTTTFGTGELIADAISSGVKTVLLGIGGTATNDAGIGLAQALGYKFLDHDRKSVHPIGKNLAAITTIERPQDNEFLRMVSCIALCDVENPLYGPSGAAYVYGPQKGATPADVEWLDRGLRNFEKVVKQSLGVDADFAGAGAGGGLGSAALVFLSASIRRGMDIISEVTRLDEKISWADLILTGEGKIDTQTLSGKVVGTVAAKAARSGKKVVAICGVCELREIETVKLGISKVITLTDPFTDANLAITNARQLLISRIITEL